MRTRTSDFCWPPAQIIQLDSETEMLVANPNLCFSHPYPPSKVMFIPDKEGTRPDLVATGESRGRAHAAVLRSSQPQQLFK